MEDWSVELHSFHELVGVFEGLLLAFESVFAGIKHSINRIAVSNLLLKPLFRRISFTFLIFLFRVIIFLNHLFPLNKFNHFYLLELLLPGRRLLDTVLQFYQAVFENLIFLLIGLELFRKLNFGRNFGNSFGAVV